MSAFSGPQGKRAMRKHRVEKRLDAEERAADFEKDVARISVEQNIDLDEARWPAAASRRLSRLMAGEGRG